MPWLSDEIPGWNELDDDEKERVKSAILDLGMDFPEEGEEEDPDYYE